MIRTAFNSMITVMMAKFMLNDVPHAVGLGNSPCTTSPAILEAHKVFSATKEAFSEVLKDSLIVAVVVFGSLVRTIRRLPGKQFRPGSDIDILVIIDSKYQVPLGYENIFHYVRENIVPFIPEQVLGYDIDAWKVDDPDTALMFVDVHEDEMIPLKGNVETAKMHIKSWRSS